MIRQLPIIFGQKDYLQTLGSKIGVTIASDGCYVSSMAMLCRYYGKQTDPVHLNQEFITRKLYVNEDMMVDDNVTKVYPDVVYQGSLIYPDPLRNEDGSIKIPGVPADLEKLRQLMSDPTISVILEISLPGGYTHFVLCVGINGVVTIANPWTKEVEDFATLYGDPATHIIKYIIYKGNPVSADVSPNDQVRIDRDLNWTQTAEIAAYLGVSLSDDRQRNVNLIKEQIDTMRTQAAENQRLADEYKSKYDEEHAKNIDLYAAHATVSKTAEDLDTKVYDAEHQAETLGNYIDAIADSAHVPGTVTDDKEVVNHVLEYIVSQEKKLEGFLKQPTDTIGQSPTLPVEGQPQAVASTTLGINLASHKPSLLQDIFSTLFSWAFVGGAA